MRNQSIAICAPLICVQLICLRTTLTSHLVNCRSYPYKKGSFRPAIFTISITRFFLRKTLLKLLTDKARWSDSGDLKYEGLSKYLLLCSFFLIIPITVYTKLSINPNFSGKHHGYLDRRTLQQVSNIFIFTISITAFFLWKIRLKLSRHDGVTRVT